MDKPAEDLRAERIRLATHLRLLRPECPAGMVTVLQRPDQSFGERRTVFLETQDGTLLGRIIFVGVGTYLIPSSATAAEELRPGNEVRFYDEVRIRLGPNNNILVDNQHSESVLYREQEVTQIELTAAHRAQQSAAESFLSASAVPSERDATRRALLLALGLAMAGVGVYDLRDEIGGLWQRIGEYAGSLQNEVSTLLLRDN